MTSKLEELKSARDAAYAAARYATAAYYAAYAEAEAETETVLV